MPIKIICRLLLLLCLFSLRDRWSSVVAEEPLQLESYIRLHYTKHEYMIPMRDGVKLMTSVFFPKDTAKQYPFLIKRTPYSVRPYGEDKYPSKLGPSELFVKANYIFVNQDVRGRFASEENSFTSLLTFQTKLSPAISMKAPTLTIRSSGFSRMCRITTVAWAFMESLIQVSMRRQE